jgi:hypothetical protein
LAPFYLPSLVAPAQPWADRARLAPDAAAAREKLLGIYDRQGAHPFILKHVNAHRAALGLPQLQRTWEMNR